LSNPLLEEEKEKEKEKEEEEEEKEKEEKEVTEPLDLEKMEWNKYSDVELIMAVIKGKREKEGKEKMLMSNLEEEIQHAVDFLRAHKIDVYVNVSFTSATISPFISFFRCVFIHIDHFPFLFLLFSLLIFILLCSSTTSPSSSTIAHHHHHHTLLLDHHLLMTSS